MGNSKCENNDMGVTKSNYRGTMNTSETGILCQKWTMQFPHEHKNQPQLRLDSGLGDHNYCRNPDNGIGAWCYTTDSAVRWMYCSCSDAASFLHCKMTNPNQIKIHYFHMIKFKIEI